VLELIGLGRRFGATVALEELSFSVAPGRIRGFVGPNGAGKTTAMRIVLGVLAPDTGEVRWRGPADRRRDAVPLRLHAGGARALPQDARPRPADVLRPPARRAGRSAGTAAARWIERLGLADRAADRVETLSLGNQQRVQLAVALVHDPEVLVLDEPFSGLDPTGVDVMSGVLRERADAGVPVVFSSHQLELVERLCDDVAIVNRGRWSPRAPSRSCASAGAATSSWCASG
jgi:ABC-2 type transport system ATP-binding protein